MRRRHYSESRTEGQNKHTQLERKKEIEGREQGREGGRDRGKGREGEREKAKDNAGERDSKSTGKSLR